MGKGNIMITSYTGSPGSGKSLHAARKMKDALRLRKKNVIANRPINMDIVSSKGRAKTGQFIYKKNTEITVPFLVDYAERNHKVGKESQTLVVIDEAGFMFNTRKFMDQDRYQWLEFFATHRHYGYDFILISQNVRMLDRQIRDCLEYEVQHFKANNYKGLGMLFTILRIPLFTAVEYVYGMKARNSGEFFRYRKIDGKLYESMMRFGDNHGENIGRLKAMIENNAPVAVGEDPGLPGGDLTRPVLNEKATKLKYRLCHTLHCDQCKHIDNCRMPWKFMTPAIIGAQ